MWLGDNKNDIWQKKIHIYTTDIYSWNLGERRTDLNSVGSENN